MSRAAWWLAEKVSHAPRPAERAAVRLESRGLIHTWMGEATARCGGRPKRMVRITGEGRRAAAAFYAAVMRASRRVAWEGERVEAPQ